MTITLQGYEINLPDAPQLEAIEGYDKPIEEQYWKKSYLISDEEFDSLSVEQQEEIIERETKRRIFGHWFMNKGKPFYLTGDNYFFLQFWNIDGKAPQFIVAQAHDFYFDYLVDNDDRCFGSIKLKPRREGCTQRTLSRVCNKATLVMNKHFGIQSKTGDDAKKVNFLNLVYGFRELPSWMKPQTSGNDIPKTELVFDRPPKRVSETQKKLSTDNTSKTYLKTRIDYQSTTANAYDGKKLKGWIGDEIGKFENADAYDTWGIVKKCLVDGFDIIGKGYLLSTIGETDENAATNFVRLWNESDANKRTDNGYTVSGLYRWFISSTCSKRGKDPRTGKEITNKYGETDEVAARELLLNERKSITDPRKLFMEIKQNPLTIEEALNFGSSSAVFDTVRLNGQKNYLMNFEPTENRPVKYQIGNLVWINNEKFGKVQFVENPNGKWKIAYFPHVAGVEMVNRYKRLPNGRTLPYSNTQFVMGIDPFDYNADDMTNGKHSNGAFYVKLKYNFSVPDLSNIYCCQYFYREADANMFYDDCIKTAFFYGAKMNPERKLYGIWRYLRDNGLINWSMIRPDISKQSDFQKKDNGYGTPTGEDTKRLGAELVEGMIAKPDPLYNENLTDNLERFYFEEGIDQLMKYDPKRSTDYDLVMAMFMTEIGCQSIKKIAVNEENIQKGETLLDILCPKYDNSGGISRLIRKTSTQHLN